MKKTIALLACAFTATGVFAKLPAPTPEQAAAADLAKAKTAYAGQVSAYQLRLSENAVANRYKAPGTPAPAGLCAATAFCSASCGGSCSGSGSCSCKKVE